MVELRRLFPGIVDNEQVALVRPHDCQLRTAASAEAPEMPDQIIDALMALKRWHQKGGRK